MRKRIAIITAVIAVTAAAAVFGAVAAKPAHALPSYQSTCSSCHSKPPSGTVTAVPSKTTLSPGEKYTVSVKIPFTNGGQYGAWIRNDAGTPTASKYGGPQTGSTVVISMTAPSAAGTYKYTAYGVRNVPGPGQTGTAGYQIKVPIRITAPTATSSWPSGSTQSVTWTVNPAYASGEFRVGLLNAAGTMVINKQVLPTAGKTSYTLSFAVTVPAATGYKAFVYYRPTVGSGAYTATVKSAAFKVTPIRITAPTATSSWRSGSTQSVTWTVNPAYASGEFRVGLLNAAGTMLINKQVLPTAGKTSYALSFAATVPAGSGYRAFVYYRPTVGTGAYTATAKSAAFIVTL